MSESKFKTMRHIETVRNYIDAVIRKLTLRSCEHDQSKLKEPEVSIFEEYTPKLRDCTYGSGKYKGYLKEMNIALEHHYSKNMHHPEFFKRGVENGNYANGICGMNLVDLIEMVCDWKAATLRHNDGDIYKSIELNQKRFGYSDELKSILINTAEMLTDLHVYHNADES